MGEARDDAQDRQDRHEQERRRAAERAAARARIEQQHSWVDQQVRVAMARGDFDDLPGAGKPIRDLDRSHDPDWWLKRLVERERITGVLPPSLQLRKDDAELDDRLAGMSAEVEVRREVEDFNARVVRARYLPPEGPPLVTMPRDVEMTVAAWRSRREERRAALAEQAAAPAAEPPPRRRWWRRRR